MHEDEGGVKPQGILITKVAACCTESEFSKWTTRLTEKRGKNILGPPKRIAEFQGNPGATTLTTEYLAYFILQSNNKTTNRRETVKKLSQQFDSHPNKESFLWDLKKH